MFSRKKTTRLFKTLAFRLTLWYASISFVSSLVAFLVFFVAINSILSSRIDEDLHEDIVEFQALLRAEGMEHVKGEIDREVTPDDADQTFLRLLHVNGDQLYASDMSEWRDLRVDKQVVLKVAAGADPVLDTAALPDHDSDTRVIYGLIEPGTVLQIGESMEDKDDLLDVMLGVFGAILIAIVALSAPVGWFMARRALQGVEEVSLAAEDIANGSFDRRVVVRSRSEEIDRLVATFNVMVDRIAALISEMRIMTDNIAHDLRSPLARIRAIAEGALSSGKSIEDQRAASADTLEECDRLLQMINTTLDVAEAEGGAAELTKEEIALSKVVKDAYELFEPLAEEKAIEMSVQLDADCRVHGNTEYVQRMLANLLDNALKYTPEKGNVSIGLSRNGEAATISVRDTGVGIAADDQTRVFERFFRGDKSRSQQGFGLGLSFARAVAHAHGGSIFVSSKVGEGTRFTITLPMSSCAS